jgi:predicted alpha/beta-fold hydrolase
VVTNERERIRTPDEDFIDIDWARKPEATRLVVITHGLEGHSRSHYCQGMATAFQKAGWDALAWNFRGCSGEPNLQLRSYHSGATEELQIVLDHVFSNKAYQEIVLVGFSLGGNLTLKYLGDRGTSIDSRIKAAVCISVPCDLASSSRQLERYYNRIYMARFMRSLRSKIREKAERFPEQLSLEGLDKMRSFAEFDNAYTAPIHGFSGADDYWARCSSRPVLGRIVVPSLVINAKDDPFLSPLCYPLETVAENPYFKLETPQNGGHLGFVTFNRQREYWSESRTVAFISMVTG